MEARKKMLGEAHHDMLNTMATLVRRYLGKQSIRSRVAGCVAALRTLVFAPTNFTIRVGFKLITAFIVLKGGSDGMRICVTSALTCKA